MLTFIQNIWDTSLMSNMSMHELLVHHGINIKAFQALFKNARQ